MRNLLRITPLAKDPGAKELCARWQIVYDIRSKWQHLDRETRGKHLKFAGSLPGVIQWIYNKDRSRFFYVVVEYGPSVSERESEFDLSNPAGKFDVIDDVRLLAFG